MIFKDVICGASLNEQSIARILKDTSTPSANKQTVVQQIDGLWKRLTQTPVESPHSYKLICYSVNLFTGDSENLTLRCWYELCSDWALSTAFRKTPSFEEIDIWNLDQRPIKSLFDAEVLGLIKEGIWMRQFSMPINENNIETLLGAQVIGGGIFNIKSFATEVLMEQFLYQQNGITPFSPWYPAKEYSINDPDWIEQFSEDQRQLRIWRRNCYLFNMISRYQAIKEAAQLVAEI